MPSVGVASIDYDDAAVLFARIAIRARHSDGERSGFAELGQETKQVRQLRVGERLIQAVRHAAFFMPAGLGVQEAAIVVLAQMTGLGQEAGILLALVKRMREVLFGCIALGGWQVAEARHNARARLKTVTVREPASEGTR